MAEVKIITKAQVVSAITKSLSEQDKYNEVKYATKAELQTEASKAYYYAGTVKTYASLATLTTATGLKNGAVYNVLQAGGEDGDGVPIKAGDNVAYNSATKKFDNLGGKIDLSAYSTTEEIAQMLEDAQETFTDDEIKAAVAAANPGVTLPDDDDDGEDNSGGE